MVCCATGGGSGSGTTVPAAGGLAELPLLAPWDSRSVTPLTVGVCECTAMEGGRRALIGRPTPVTDERTNGRGRAAQLQAQQRGVGARRPLASPRHAHADEGREGEQQRVHQQTPTDDDTVQ